MIESLTGTLAVSNPSYAILQTSGIAWNLPITLSTYDHLPSEGETVTIPTYLAVKEDSLTLYGFVDTNERDLFQKLLQVNGIGPKLAMTVLSGLPSSEFIRAVSAGDAKALHQIPGVGKKMAERMLMELKDKIQTLDQSPSVAPENVLSKSTRDAVLALVALGYKQQEAKLLLDRIPAEEQQECDVEELVRLALHSS